MKKNAVIVFVLILFISTNFLYAKQDKEDFSIWGSGEVFKINPLTDSLIIGGSATLFGIDIYLDKVANFHHPDFNKYTLDINTIPLFDQLLMTDYSKTLNYISTGTLGLCGLTSAVFLTIPSSEWLTIGTMYAESLLMAFSIKEFGKIMINRPRPYMYYENYPVDKIADGDWIQSFPSGHTTAAFTMATFTSYIYCSYFPESKFRLPVIATSFGLATTTAVLRVASGCHFYSDVIAGAVIGAFCGFTVPYLHTRGTAYQSKNIYVSATPYNINCCIKY